MKNQLKLRKTNVDKALADLAEYSRRKMTDSEKSAKNEILVFYSIGEKESITCFNMSSNYASIIWALCNLLKRDSKFYFDLMTWLEDRGHLDKLM
jgi:hypothetical protein